MEMITWRQGALLAILLLVVGFFSVPGRCQQPRRRPRDRVIAAQDDIPVTNFSCANKAPGYYADVEAGCQVYHMCDGGRQFSYRCPDTTLFQQRMLICAHWYQVNCSRSEQHYNANLLIGQRDKPFVEEADYINIYFNGKGIKTLKNPEDLQSLNHGNGRIPQQGQVFHNSKVEATVNNPQVNTFSTHAASTERVFTNTQTNLNSQFSNQNFNSRTTPTQTSFTNINTNNFNSQFASLNLKSHIAPTQAVFTNTNPSQIFQFTTQNFKSPATPPPPPTVFTNANPSLITQFSNQNVKQFGSHSTPKPSLTFHSTTFAPFTKHITSTSTPQTQFDQKTSTNHHFTNENVNTPIIQTNEYNNFIKRFNPDSITEAIIKDDRKEDSYSQYNNFIKRFNPDEVSLENVNINKVNQSVATFVNSNIFSSNNFKTPNLQPPVQQPSSNIELPYKDDSDQMESNNLELHFQDPRQVFFIPESDSQIIPAESATPITVNIPRNVGQQFHPMLFVNAVHDACFRCHPSFIVNKASCTPCVIIR